MMMLVGPINIMVDACENRSPDCQVDDGEEGLVTERFPAKAVRLNLPGAEKTAINGKCKTADDESNEPPGKRAVLSDKMPHISQDSRSYTREAVYNFTAVVQCPIRAAGISTISYL